MQKRSETVPTLEIKDLRVSFSSVVGTSRAVNGVNLRVNPGEIVGVVGESGCGKSVTARSIVGLLRTPPARVEGGEIWLQTEKGRVNTLNLLHSGSKQLQSIRGREVSMIFQEPMRSLHPMKNIGNQITEVLKVHRMADSHAALALAEEMLRLVNLPSPAKLLTRYPHELSGGMRQRIMIALALICRPRLLIADEPTTALDVTIQAQILSLIRDLRDELGMSVLLITHNMGVIASTAERVYVMYVGVVVESGSVAELFANPTHPYTQGLLSSIPDLFSEPKTQLHSMTGVVPELAEAPTGCVFADRCPKVMFTCAKEPPVINLSPTQSTKCWLYVEHGTEQGIAKDG